MSQPLGLSTGAINTGVTAGAIGVPAAAYGALSGTTLILLFGVVLTLALMIGSTTMFFRGELAHRAERRRLHANLLPSRPPRANRIWRR